MCREGIFPKIPPGPHLNPAPYISKFTSSKNRKKSKDPQWPRGRRRRRCSVVEPIVVGWLKTSARVGNLLQTSTPAQNGAAEASQTHPKLTVYLFPASLWGILFQYYYFSCLVEPFQIACSYLIALSSFDISG